MVFWLRPSSFTSFILSQSRPILVHLIQRKISFDPCQQFSWCCNLLHLILHSHAAHWNADSMQTWKFFSFFHLLRLMIWSSSPWWFQFFFTLTKWENAILSKFWSNEWVENGPILSFCLFYLHKIAQNDIWTSESFDDFSGGKIFTVSSFDL